MEFEQLVPILRMAGGIITGFLSVGVLSWFLPVRSNWWAKGLIFIGCVTLVNMVIFVGDRDNLPGTLLWFGFTVLLCCQGTWLQKISIALILASLSTSFNALIDTFIWGVTPYRLILWIFLFLFVRRFAPKQQYELSSHLWILLDLLVMAPFSIVTITVLMNDMESFIFLRDAFLLLIAFLSSWGFFWALVVFARQQKLEQEWTFSQINQAYYRNLEQEQLQIRRLRHDMANHLQVMAGLTPEKMKEYVEQLIHSPAMDQLQRFCANHVVNAVLSVKYLRMEQCKIRTEITVSLPAELPIAEVDLCALFANSLDNAIEACEELSEEQRYIKVKSQADKGIFVLQIQNSMKGNLKKTEVGFATSKKDTQQHGFGLSSIQQIVTRYGGALELKPVENEFEFMLYIPLL